MEIIQITRKHTIQLKVGEQLNRFRCRKQNEKEECGQLFMIWLLSTKTADNKIKPYPVTWCKI
jgi:hypothetical protein